jgi:excisionase family DNA binding protein
MYEGEETEKPPTCTYFPKGTHMSPEALPRLVSRKQAAEALAVSTDTLRRWQREGRIAAVRVGARIRFKREDVEALLRPVDEGEVAKRRPPQR